MESTRDVKSCYHGARGDSAVVGSHGYGVATGSEEITRFASMPTYQYMYLVNNIRYVELMKTGEKRWFHPVYCEGWKDAPQQASSAAPVSRSAAPVSRSAAPVRWTVSDNGVDSTPSTGGQGQAMETDSSSTTGGVKRAWDMSPESTAGSPGNHRHKTDQIRKKNASAGGINVSRKSADPDRILKRSGHSTARTTPRRSLSEARITPRRSPNEEHREATLRARASVAQQREPSFFIGGSNGTALVEATLLELGWKRVTEKYNENFKLKWVESKSTINYGSFKEGEQLVNRIPNCSLLTNKLGLLNSLQRYDRVNATIKGRNIKTKSSEFMPETYRVDDQIDRKLFLETYRGETWICKPAGMNQGRGIYLVRDIEDFKKILEDRDEKMKKSKRPGIERIVQRYIQRPLLLEGRKFDVRAFLLVGCTSPYLILYHKGYVRRCLHNYKVDDTNLVAHLTNQFVQKRDSEYKANHEDTVWSMDKFNDYINEYVAPYKGLPRDWVYTHFTARMKQIMLFCFNSVKHKLKCRMGYFDLYGLDFMIDDEMKVWLIEINANPSLSVSSKALKEVIPGLVKETLHISIECFEKVRKNKTILPVQAVQNFEVLYCGNNSRLKPGNGNRIESGSPNGTSPTGFLTDRPMSLSPLQRSRSLSPTRDFSITAQTARSHHDAAKLSTLIHTIHHRHVTYQTPPSQLANQKQESTSLANQKQESTSQGNGKQQSPGEANQKFNSTTNVVNDQQNKTKNGSSAPEKYLNNENGETRGQGQDNGQGQDKGKNQDLGQPIIILNEVKINGSNQYNNVHSGINPRLNQIQDQTTHNRSSLSEVSNTHHMNINSNLSQSQRMPRLEERAVTFNKIYTRSQPTTPRPMMSPAMVGLWGTNLPDLQQRMERHSKQHRGNISDKPPRDATNSSTADSIKFRMTHVAVASKGSSAKPAETRSPNLHLMPRNGPKAYQSIGTVLPPKRLMHKVSLTGIRMTDSEKDILVDIKNNSKQAPISAEISRLADIKYKDGALLEDTRQTILSAQRSAPPGVKQHLGGIPTARLTDLSSDLKVDKEPVKPSALLVRQQDQAKETVTNDLGLENPAHARSRSGKLKNRLSPKTQGSSPQVSPRSRRKMDQHGRPKNEGRLGAS